MSVLHRLFKVVLAIIVSGLIYTFFFWRSDWNTALPSSDLLKTIDTTSSSLGTHLELIEAHTLQTADSFLPHFSAITKMPGMTMAEAKADCIWPMLHEVNFQYDESSDWVVRDRSDAELEMRRKEWHNFVDNQMLPYEKFRDRFGGRGIIIVAGNARSIKRVKVLLRALTKLHCQLPVELHYWKDEISEEARSNLASSWPRMYFNDLSASSNILKTNHDGDYINYQLKTAAVINSRFAEPLLLDSDNIPTLDPTLLYESSTYKEFGTLFWPDIARTRPNNPMWAITNTQCRVDEYEMESGQLVVDKRRYFYHLQLASWFNNEHAKYYNEFLLGDKDMFRFAWHALKTKYGFPAKWLTSVGFQNDGYYCGNSFAQYDPDGRIAFMHGGLIKTMTKEVMSWQRDSRGGIFQVYKRSDYDEQHIVNVNVSIKFDVANYLPNRPFDLAAAACTDLYDVVARPLDEILPGFEATFEEIGGYWILEE